MLRNNDDNARAWHMNQNADIMRGVSNQRQELGHIAAERRKRLHREGACGQSAGGLYFCGALHRSAASGADNAGAGMLAASFSGVCVRVAAALQLMTLA